MLLLYDCSCNVVGPTLAAGEHHLHTNFTVVSPDLRTQRHKAKVRPFHPSDNSVQATEKMDGDACGAGHVTDVLAPCTASWLPRCPGSWRGWGRGWCPWGGTGRAEGPSRWRRRPSAPSPLVPPPAQEETLHRYDPKSSLRKLDTQWMKKNLIYARMGIFTINYTIKLWERTWQGLDKLARGATATLKQFVLDPLRYVDC